MYEWSPASWQRFPCEQAVHYPNPDQLGKVIEQIKNLPPLVTRAEILNLKKVLQKAERGEAFILQGGDCAEAFADCRPSIIQSKIKTLLQMYFILENGINMPIILIGRIAGQYTKPRSLDYETIQGVSLPAYRGDMVNSSQFDSALRIPDPDRLLQGYYCSATTLNFIRSTFNEEVRTVKNNSPLSNHSKIGESRPLSLFTSHEALNLYYEQALTRQLEDKRYYNLSTHLPWVGMRTLKLGAAHLEFLRGVDNPLGIKIGPDISPESLTEIIKVLNPNFESGRLLLITRLGAGLIEKRLPYLIEAVQKLGCPVTWSCDPMHGNTISTSENIKTRHFDTIFFELQKAIEIHRAMQSCLNGVHLELTGENVNECVGGFCGVSESDLKISYKSLVDPRLNGRQSLELATHLSKLIFKKEIEQILI